MRYLDRLLADPRVESVSDERRADERGAQNVEGDGIWVYLRDGYVAPDGPFESDWLHAVHEWNLTALREAMANVCTIDQARKRTGSTRT